MPTDFLSALPAVAALVEKLGVIGVLLIAIGWLVNERLRLLRELVGAYKQRDRWRLAAVKYKSACDNHEPPIKVDVSDLADLMEQTS